MEILTKYFPGLSPLQMDRYQGLNDRLRFWNRQVNLVSRKDIGHLAERHILHSLGIALFACFCPDDQVLDVGTGGGFPGLPLAIMFPEARFTLIDSIGKKIRAVEEISRGLDLPNVRCLQVRAEDFREKVRHVVSRAVTGLDRFTAWVGKNLEKDILPAERASGKSAMYARDPRKAASCGIWYLKGGDLGEELKSFPDARVHNLNEVFSEPYFETKKLIWIPPASLP